MKQTAVRSVWIWWSLLVAAILACQGVAVVPPDSATAVRPVATLTTAVTPPSQGVPSGFRTVSAPEHGLSFAIPEDWELQIDASGVGIYSRWSDVEAAQGVVMTLLAQPARDMDVPGDPYGDSAIDLLRAEINRWIFYTPSARFQMQRPAEGLTLNEWEAATTRFHLQSDRYPPPQLPPISREIEAGWQPTPDDIWLSVAITMVRYRQTAVSAIAVMPVTEETRYSDQIEAIVRSLHIGPATPAAEDG